ncbi:RING finger protein 24 isoform X1 [Opisthocomus hoazin]|uniref:RING finger protein 24 isoform X1 n=1 Tax=Opisthocomus hoazin TaxID=30419 RepID=UPI003F52DB4F
MRGRVVGAGCQSPRTDQISCEQLPRRSRSLARSRVAPPPELKLDRPSEKSGRDAEEQEEERGPGCGKPGRGSPSAACCFCSSSGAVSVGRENFWLIFFILSPRRISLAANTAFDSPRRKPRRERFCKRETESAERGEQPPSRSQPPGSGPLSPSLPGNHGAFPAPGLGGVIRGKYKSSGAELIPVLGIHGRGGGRFRLCSRSAEARRSNPAASLAPNGGSR